MILDTHKQQKVKDFIKNKWQKGCTMCGHNDFTIGPVYSFMQWIPKGSTPIYGQTQKEMYPTVAVFCNNCFLRYDINSVSIGVVSPSEA